MSLENQEITQNLKEEKIAADKKIKLLAFANGVLLLLLVVLYILFFTSKGGGTTKVSSDGQEVQAPVESLKIGYVNAEEFNENYQLAKKFREDLEAEQSRLEADFSRRQRNLQNDFEKFQRDAQTGAASADVLQAKEQELIRRQQELVQLNETYTSRLIKRERDMQAEMMQVFDDFFGRYNLTRGYDFILRYTPILGMYYVNDKHDITQEVLEMMNAEYVAPN